MRRGGISGRFLELIFQVLEDPAVTIQFIVSGLQGHEYERAGGCLVLDHDSNPAVAIYLSKYTAFFFFFKKIHGAQLAMIHY